MLLMLKRINYILDRRQKRNLAILSVIIIVGSLLETMGVSAILPLVNVISNPEVINEHRFYRTVKEILNIDNAQMFAFYMAMMLIVVYVVKNFYLMFQYYMTYRYTWNNQKRISYRLMQCYMAQDYLFHVSHNVAELQRNCSSDVNAFIQVLLNIIQLMTEAITVTFLVVFLAVQDFQTTLAVFVLMCIYLYIMLVIYKKTLVRMGELSRKLGAFANKWFLQSFGGIKEIKVSNREQFFLNHYDEAYQKQIDLSKKQSVLSIVPRPAMETLLISGLLGFIAFRIYMGADLKAFVPTLSVFAVAAVRLLPSFNRISGCFSMITYSKSSVESVYNDLHDIEGLRLAVEQDNQDDTVIDISNGVVLKDLKFAYPTRKDKVILDRINIEIPKNKSVAFVGPSGAGKTTLADVVLGVLKPQEGQVMADGVDVYEHLHAWHKVVGYIPQNIYLIDDTIRANVAFGVDEKEVTDEKIWKALREAQLEDFVKSLPDGLDTNIGSMGVKFSGGQRQRIGIARALYEEPQVLVLDEATSALDTETETAVMESINQLAGTKTMIIIAHRLTTIRNCDIVYEVRDGAVTERDVQEVIAEAFKSSESES